MPKEGEKSPDSTQHLIGYRFGEKGGADPKEAQKKKTSIRAATRRFAAMDVGDAVSLSKDKDEFNKLSLAQAVALSKFKKALSGDVRAMQQLEDSVDGKLVERKVEATTTLEELVLGSFDYEEKYAEVGDEQGDHSKVEA